MKLKHLPEDFQVEDAHRPATGRRPAGPVPADEAPGLGTPEAVEAVARRWKLPLCRIAWAV